MIEKTFKLSETGRAMLMLGATREDRLIPPPTLPVAAARQVVRSLLNAGMIQEVPAPAAIADYFWREGDDGTRVALRATALGLNAIAVSPETAGRPEPAADAAMSSEVGSEEPPTEGEETPAAGGGMEAQGARQAGTVTAFAKAGTRDEAAPGDPVPQPPATPRVTVRQAAEHLLQVWDAAENGAPSLAELEGHVGILRGLLARRRATPSDHVRKPREGTKQANVLTMLRRPEGATVGQIAEAMNWAPHTVRGFFAGLKKRKGIVVAPAERVRQIGEEGAKGSYTIYRIAETN